MNFLESIKNKLKKKEVVDIVYYGPSTTSVEYVLPNWGEIIWRVLKMELDKDFSDYHQVWWNLFAHNTGLDGATSGDLLARLNDRVLKKKPMMVFLQPGTNDFYFKVDKKETRKNITAMIRKLLKKGIKVVYWTDAPSVRPDRNTDYEDNHQIEMKIAEKFKEDPNFLFINIFKLFSKDAVAKSYTLIETQSNESLGLMPGDLDYVHFNRYGNVIVAKILLKEAFGINFDENKFLQSLSDNSNKYPKY